MAWYSFLTGLFTGSKAGTGIVTGAIKGIDALIFTDEEKANFSKEVMTLWLDVQKVTANESSIRSVTRRILAVGFIASYLFLVLGGCAVYKWDVAYSQFLFDTAMSLNTPVLTIIIFYFGYYAVSNIIKAKKG
jgi:hypothetical protein